MTLRTPWRSALVVAAMCLATPAWAGSIAADIAALSDSDLADAAVESLAKHGEAAVPRLAQTARDANADIAVRGWALQALTRIGGTQAQQAAMDLLIAGQHPPLVRSWAAAALVWMAEDTSQLQQAVGLAASYPGTTRAVRLKGEEMAAGNPEVLLVLLRIQSRPEWQQSLLATPPEQLVRVLLTSTDPSVRQMAASYLGSQASRNGAGDVQAALVEGLRFDSTAKAVPWAGGPLWLPSLNLVAGGAQELVEEMLSWLLWCERNGDTQNRQVLLNNLQGSNFLVQATQNNNWAPFTTDNLLVRWGQTQGSRRVYTLMQRTGALRDPHWADVLERIDP